MSLAAPFSIVFAAAKDSCYLKIKGFKKKQYFYLRADRTKGESTKLF
jgi:hypothetical protein